MMVAAVAPHAADLSCQLLLTPQLLGVRQMHAGAGRARAKGPARPPASDSPLMLTTMHGTSRSFCLLTFVLVTAGTRLKDLTWMKGSQRSD